MKLTGIAPLIALLVMPIAAHAGADVQPLNAVIGDASYVATYGAPPTAATSEQDRLTTHLTYVHRMLSENPPPGLTPELAEARARNLGRLQAYIAEQRFPINNVCLHKRVPVFVDDVGTRCAVAYLAEHDLGTDAVVSLAEEYRYDFLPDIDAEALHAWQAASGMTPEELATIQPAYGGQGSACRLNAGATPCPLLACPAGDTDSFADQGWTIDIWVRDFNYVPIVGVPASDFWLIDCDPLRDAALCGGANSTSADAASDANGKTTMSLSTLASGSCADGIAIVVQGFVLLDSLTGYTTEKCLPVWLRSPDIDGNLAVNLVDLSIFAASFPPAGYDPCCDMNIDGTVGLQDLSVFAFHFGPPGHECL